MAETVKQIVERLKATKYAKRGNRRNRRAAATTAAAKPAATKAKAKADEQA